LGYFHRIIFDLNEFMEKYKKHCRPIKSPDSMTNSVLKRTMTIFTILIMAFPVGMITISNVATVAAQDTQIPLGWVKFNPHSHGMFDVHAENGSVVGTIDESHLAFFGTSTGHTISNISDEFGANGVMVHTPHSSSFETYKDYWQAERDYENTQYSTTTNVTLGEEYNLNGRHIGLVNISYFRSTTDYTNFKELRDNITSQGAIMIINHPSDGWIGNPQIFLQPGYEFDAMEIYNGRVEILEGPLAVSQTDGRGHYRNAITQGRQLAAIGGSDAHNNESHWQVYTVAEDPLGENNLDAVVRAIKNQRTYAAAYDMDVYDRSFYIECNEMGQVIETRDLTINVSPPSANTYTVDMFRNNDTSPVQTWSLSGDTSITYTIPIMQSKENAAYSFEIYEGGSATTSDALAYSTAIWYQPEIEYNLTLIPGWNLVSFPLELNTTIISEVLSSIQGDYNVIHWYDPILSSWQIYPGEDFELSNKISFWMHMKYASTLNILGKMPFYTRIPLYSSGNGWNMVGFPSQESKTVQDAIYYIQDKYISIQNYNASDSLDPWKHFHKQKTNNDLQILRSGQGYWIKVTEDCELVVFN
jgi:hypothetical protein